MRTLQYLLALIFIVGSSDSARAGVVDADAQELLVGSWVLARRIPDGKRFARTAYGRDQTFETILFADPACSEETARATGNWIVSKGRLVTRVRYSSKPNEIKPGRTFVDEILGITDQELTIRTKSGRQYRLIKDRDRC